jgi:hypothetical protein
MIAWRNEHDLFDHKLPPAFTTAHRQNVRFGSKADICSAKGHVRFTPNSDIDQRIDLISF